MGDESPPAILFREICRRAQFVDDEPLLQVGAAAPFWH
jgi:hypothetical protein